MTTVLDNGLSQNLTVLSAVAPLVMVVQYDRDQREALCDLLEVDGYRVVEAQNGRSALEHLRSKAEKPRLLLADYELHLISGADLLHILRETPVLCRIPGVLMSMSSDIEREAKLLGAVMGLRKPLSAGLVLQTVGWLTGRNVARP